MKWIIISVMILCLVSAVSAQQDIYFSEYLTTDINVSSSVDVVATAANYDMLYLNAKLYFFPEGYENQFVTVTSTEPKSTREENTINFRWTDVREGSLDYHISTRVKVKNDINKIKNKIKFPLEDVPEDILAYTQSTEKIDSDTHGIVSLANLLVQGEDDLYVVTHKLASWVEDSIQYNLSTVTADVQQKASWVLSKKQGVCDEITVLFMALCRSLGIPAKFVAGTAYTESPLFPERWGAHGWAEVYFPGHGWVPFDITYGEMGWVDPSHIKLRESIDPTEPSARFEWKGKYTSINTYPLKIDASIYEYGSKLPEDIRLSADSLKGGIDFGSYDMIEAEVQNLRDYYVATNVNVAAASEVEILDNPQVHVLLKPNQKKKLYWRIRISPNLNTRYVYTIPILVYTGKNISKKVRITSSVKEPHYTKGEIDEYYDRMNIEEFKRYSTDISLSCTKDREFMYTYEKLLVECAVKNMGNTLLNDLDICLKTDCQTTDLGITQETNPSFEVEFDSSGKKDISLTVKNEEIFQTHKMEIQVYDIPQIEISNLHYDDVLNYDSEGQIGFVLARTSYSVPVNITLTLKKDVDKTEWELPELKEDKEFIIDIKGKEFTKEVMPVHITAEYKDLKGKDYLVEKEFSISLEEPSFTQKIKIFLNKITTWIVNLF